jgi:hypothetical protein
MAFEGFDDFTCAFKIAPEHRAAAIDGPAVAVDPNHIDVGCPLCLAFLEDVISLIDHRIQSTLDNFLIGYIAFGKV